MANLGSLSVIPVNIGNNQIKRLESITFKNMKFGATMTSSGLGAVSDAAVGDQGIVVVPETTEPIQYWG